MSRCHNRPRCTPVPEDVRRAADILGRRWAVSLLWAAHHGAHRFNEFTAALGPIPPRTLATRLLELEQAGLIDRVVLEGRPPRVEYRLTPRGAQLERLLAELTRWAGARPTR